MRSLGIVHGCLLKASLRSKTGSLTPLSNLVRICLDFSPLELLGKHALLTSHSGVIISIGTTISCLPFYNPNCL